METTSQQTDPVPPPCIASLGPFATWEIVIVAIAAVSIIFLTGLTVGIVIRPSVCFQ